MRSVAHWMFHGHLWLGVLVTVMTLVLAVTGILLNHKKSLGLMPGVDHAPTAPIDQALPLSDLIRSADERVGPEVAAHGVDRMDVRPSDGIVKVRYTDPSVTEVTLDLATGRVLAVGERNDVFLEKLHSGEIFGDGWVLLSDAVAIALALLLVSGYWMWLYPRSRM